MNVFEIVSKYLVENGFDGLFSDGGECGCLLDDLCPCDGEIGNCEPGYKLPGDEEYDFLVGPEKPPKPKIICLCGSTRFWEKFRDEGLRLTKEGYIVLSIGICAPDSMVLARPDSVEGKEEKRKLDELHKRKIDLADEILILNVGGYIGESTQSEIEYAKAHGKIIYYLETKEEM